MIVNNLNAITRVVCNLTWRCSLPPCIYCWIYGKDGVGSGFVDQTQHRELSAKQWITALARLPGRGIVDFCGGEPTLHEGFVEIVNNLNPNYGWAVTTNLAQDRNAEVLSLVENRRGVAVTASYHYHTPFDDWLVRLRWLGNLDRFPVSVTFVQSPYMDYRQEIERLKHLRNLPKIVANITLQRYQNPQDSNLPISQELWGGRPSPFCTAGKVHIGLAPSGDIYRCTTAFQSNRRNEFTLGNLLTTDPLVFRGGPCDLNCDPVCSSGCWGIKRERGVA